MNKKLLITFAIVIAVSIFGVNWSVANAQSTILVIPDTGTKVVAPLIPVTGGGYIIDAGYGHTCMTSKNGVLCWGLNSSGQVGDGTTTDQHVPVYVKILGSVSSLSLGSNHSCALIGDGTVWCWGKNSSGQLGNGTTEDSSIPVQVLGLPKRATALTAGQNFNCVILVDNSIWCWGENTNGQLNDGSTTNRLEAVKSIYTAAPSLISGGQTTVVAEASGFVSHWNNSSPTNIEGLSDANNISGNRFNPGGCAVTSDNVVECWTKDNEPIEVDESEYSRYVIAGLAFGCAVDQENKVLCWGSNEYGQLGNGTNQDDKAAQVVPNLGSIADLGVGSNHSCVIITPTDVKCWGWNSHGQLGDDSTTDSSVPVQVVLP